MITKERTQRLESLQHLVANLARGIIVCGPEGIGKTKMLKLFQDAAPGTWLTCFIKGNSQLSIEAIQQSISQALSEKMPHIKFRALNHAFERFAEQEVKIVLVIDDAGLLMPGLIESVISYADDKPALRTIFALTHSELFLKSRSDPSVEDCYQIEIPTLSERQCGEFLEYLSTLPKPRVLFTSINETRIATLYRETHGIPGKILTQLPVSVNPVKPDNSKAILMFAVIGLIALALGVQWWSSHRIAGTKKTTAIAKNQHNKIQQPALSIEKNHAVSVQSNPPEINAQAASGVALQQNPQVPAVVPAPSDVQDNQGLAKDQLTTNGGQNTPNAVIPEKTVHPQTTETVKPTEVIITKDKSDPNALPSSEEGGRWIKGEMVGNFTLQLMALSNERTIVEVMQKHPELGQKLHYIKTKTRSGRDRFVLVYGSYATVEEANKDVGYLPKELQKTWARQIGTIQKEMPASMTPNTTE